MKGESGLEGPPGFPGEQGERVGIDPFINICGINLCLVSDFVCFV